MGFNTTVVILNDGIPTIEAHPEEFVKNLLAAIYELNTGHKGINVPCGNHCNVAQVIDTHHADYTHLIAVGGNYGTDLGYVGGAEHHKPETIRVLAENLLRSFPKKKTKKVKKKLAKVLSV